MKRIASLLLLLAITLTLAAQNITVASITLDEKGITFDVGVLKIAFPIRKICWTDKFFIPSHQQNPPRFSLDQRTRAGLLLYMSTIRRVSGTYPSDPQSERGTPPYMWGCASLDVFIEYKGLLNYAQTFNLFSK